MYEYKAKVLRVVDGDTFDVDVDLGFNISFTIRLRLNGIDTPEIRTKNLLEKEHGLAATERVRELIEKKIVKIKTYHKGKYGRYIADIYLKDEISLVELLIAEGFSKRKKYES